MNTAQINCFLVAAKSHSFTAAAEELFVSQATVSRNISAMEAELGFDLFERKSNTVVLTPAGATMLEAFQSMHATFEDAEQRALNISQGVLGTLRLGILDGQSIHPSLRVALNQFSAIYPEIDIEFSSLSYEALTQGLMDGSLDAIVTVYVHVQNQDWVKTKTIDEIKTYLIIPYDHRLAGKDGLHLVDFKDDTFVLSRSFSTPEQQETQIELIFKNRGFKPNLLLVPDIRTQLLMLETGRGVAFANIWHMMYNSPVLKGIELPELSSTYLTLAWAAGSENGILDRFLELLG